MQREIHTFDNGIKVYDDHLLPQQRQRYNQRNVHEAQEESVFIDLLGRIPSDGIYLDIGAAIGYYPLLAKRLSPSLHIHAVEPLRRHRAFFLENIHLNGFSPTDFAIYDQAVAAVNGTVKFVDAGYGSFLLTGLAKNTSPKNLVKSLLRRLLPQTIQTITAISLDRLVERIGAPIHLVQIDVQGLELDVLHGAKRSLENGHIHNFLIGTHGTRIHRACASYLQQYRYQIEIDMEQTQTQPDGILVSTTPG